MVAVVKVRRSGAATPAAGATRTDLGVAAAPPRGFRPVSRRRARLAGGVALAAVAIGGNVAVYSSVDSKSEVVQLVDNVRAGEQITTADLRVVEADLDPTVPHVAAEAMRSIVGQYAVTYLASGTLIIPQLVQPSPLVAAGTGVVAIDVGGGGLPSGLLERSRVQLVYSDPDGQAIVEGRVVARTVLGGNLDDGDAITVEVPVDAAAPLAAAHDVRVVLLEADADPAVERG